MTGDITHAEVAARLRSERQMVIMAHENPDGDALGCVVALALMAQNLGIPHCIYLPGRAPLPAEYTFLPGLDRALRGPMPKMEATTTAYVLDCATANRLDVEGLRCAGACINIDHHHDNTRFGTLNLLDFEAASATQILFDIFMSGNLPIDARIATALYVGLTTDTGRFQYSNTTPAAHRMAARLQEMGADVAAVAHEIYESMALSKVLLIRRALERMQLHLDGGLAVSWLTAEDFAEAGADESQTEGVIDSLRMIKGVRVAALLRERLNGARGEYKGSLRSTDGSIDVSAVAHQRGGGGHLQAAGFTAAGPLEDLLEWLVREVGTRL
ncbi:MAG: bifunctional oligoribonuclease/PAP phosphatase NrnA [Thermoleophilia bacterium]|nr:bifunctional oligoribonuclease/PAP phosphatase NrnA [Thermoleophilia bacterium]